MSDVVAFLVACVVFAAVWITGGPPWAAVGLALVVFCLRDRD